MSRQVMLERLTNGAPLIAPSMLKCDFGNLHREVELLESSGAQILHLDVMDGHFVPNLSYGPMVIRSLRQLTKLPFDAHLMISNPEQFLDEFLEAGCDVVTFHVEAVADPAPLLKRISAAGALAGLAINPGTPVEAITSVIELCDLILVMSVEPGFGGQAFMPSALDKLRKLAELKRTDALLSVDGGIGPKTIAATAEAGADVFVVGSAIFDTNDYEASLTHLAQLAGRAADDQHPRSL